MKRAWVRTATVLATVGLVAFAESSFASIPSPRFDLDPAVDESKLTQECRDFISTALPQHGWTGGFVEVPEDWQNPASRRIQVFYYHNVPTQSAQLENPILFLNGGPFTSYRSRMEALSKRLDEYDTGANRHVFVMMDQRGVGCSTPNMPENGPADVGIMGRYGSTQIVQDAEIIRQKLFGARQWKILAQSYGGFLAARYLERFPASISELHVYGPVYHESMADFFWMRIAKQNDVLRTFLARYAGDRLERAIAKISGPDGGKYCIFGGAEGPAVCGRPLLDVFLATIGQGPGRELGSTELWDGVRQGMLALIESDPDNAAEANHRAFLGQARGASLFFHNPSMLMVVPLWSQDLAYVDGNNAHDCRQAYSTLRSRGVDVERLPLDECRIIENMIPPFYQAALQAGFSQYRGTDLLPQARLAELLRANPATKFFLYTGGLDSLAQVESLAPLIASGALAGYANYPELGHSGWMFEPTVWRNLLGSAR